MKKNKWLKIVAILSGITIFSAMPVFASNYELKSIAVQDENEQSVLLPEEKSWARDTVNGYPRGSIISTAIADITNEGDGVISILVETLAHTTCDEIRNIAYLDQWSEADQDWYTVKRYEFVEYLEDHPDGDFTAMTNTVTVKDQPSGYYYRVRGVHSVWKNGERQSFTTRTNGVMITK